MAPNVTIRVPFPWKDGESEAERRAHALRCARQLIEHACRAAGVGPMEAEESAPLEDVLEAVTPSGLEGIAQELGLATPTSQPRRETSA